MGVRCQSVAEEVGVDLQTGEDSLRSFRKSDVVACPAGVAQGSPTTRTVAKVGAQDESPWAVCVVWGGERWGREGSGDDDGRSEMMKNGGNQEVLRVSNLWRAIAVYRTDRLISGP